MESENAWIEEFGKKITVFPNKMFADRSIDADSMILLRSLICYSVYCDSDIIQDTRPFLAIIPRIKPGLIKKKLKYLIKRKHLEEITGPGLEQHQCIKVISPYLIEQPEDIDKFMEDNYNLSEIGE